MRWWVKALAIGVGLLLVCSVISAILHLLYLAVLAIAIGAVVAIAIRARSRWRASREVKSSERQAKVPQAPMALPQPDPHERAVSLHDDVEAELARLRREME